MTDWFLSGGFIMWPLLALGLGVLALAVRAAVGLRSTTERRSLAPILFWGAVAPLVGALGTVVGLVIMARQVSAAGGASTGLIWGGVGLTLVSLAFGILIFLMAAFLWLALDAWQRRRMGRSAGAGLVCLLLPLAAVAAGCGDPSGGQIVVSDSAGVRVVENLGPDRAFTAVPERVTTLQPPDSALTAMPWGVVADPASGRIFVADGTAQRVVVFDAEGAFTGTIGREGGGPGEFRSPTALAMGEDGTLSVWDARRGIISRWSTDGALLDERQAPLNYWGPGFAVGRDGVIAVTQETTGNQRRQSLMEATVAGDPRELFAVTRELVRLDLPGMSMPAPRIFAPDLVWAAAGDTVLVLNGPGYRIDAIVEGRPVASIRRDLGPIPVTGAMAAAFVEGGPYRGFMRRAGLSAEQIVAAVGYEEVTSPVQWIATDPSGRLWVTRGGGRPVPDRTDVLDPDGRYVGTFQASGMPVAFPSDSTFVALEVTDLGPALALYRLDSTGEARAAPTLPTETPEPLRDPSAGG